MRRICKIVPVFFAVVLAFVTQGLAAGGDTLGTVSELLEAKCVPGATVTETTLGNAAADAIRAVLQTDVGIVCGGDLRANLQPGEASWEDIEAVFVADRAIGIAEITPAQLRGILEAGVSRQRLSQNEMLDEEGSKYDGYPQVSGIQFEFDVSAPVGQRVRRITLLNGTELSLDDGETVLTLAATVHMLEGGYDMPAMADYTQTDYTLVTAFGENLSTHGSVERPEINRVYLFGTAKAIFTEIPGMVLIFAVILLLISASPALSYRRNPYGDESSHDDYNPEKYNY